MGSQQVHQPQTLDARDVHKLHEWRRRLGSAQGKTGMKSMVCPRSDWDEEYGLPKVRPG